MAVRRYVSGASTSGAFEPKSSSSTRSTVPVSCGPGARPRGSACAVGATRPATSASAAATTTASRPPGPVTAYGRGLGRSLAPPGRDRRPGRHLEAEPPGGGPRAPTVATAVTRTAQCTPARAPPHRVAGMSEQVEQTTPTDGRAQPRSGDRIVWIDCEMTGLALVARRAHRGRRARHRLRAERARRRRRRRHPARRPRRSSQMADVVRDMHTTSGLLERARRRRHARGGRGSRCSAYVREHVPEPGTAPLRGNSVGTDRGFLARDMPELDGLPALPDRRRVLDQGAGPPLVPAGLLQRARRRTAATARSPTSARPSRSCATTARPSSCRRPARTPTPPGRSPPTTSCPAAHGPRAGAGRGPRRRPGTLLAGRGRRSAAAADMVGVAQLVEHLVVVQDVAGSSPVTHPHGTPLVRTAGRGAFQRAEPLGGRARRDTGSKRGLDRLDHRGVAPGASSGAQRLDCARPPGGRTGGSDRGCG